MMIDCIVDDRIVYYTQYVTMHTKAYLYALTGIH